MDNDINWRKERISSELYWNILSIAQAKYGITEPDDIQFGNVCNSFLRALAQEYIVNLKERLQ